MSDRIDELVSNIEDGLHGKCGFTLSESSLNNLATIARRAEARALKAEATVRRMAWDRLNDTYSAGTIDDDGEWADEMVEAYIAAASEAVSK